MTDSGIAELEARLREAFASDIASQRNQYPSLALVLAMARIDARNRKQSMIGRLRAWSEALALGGSAGLLAVFWSELASGLESLLQLAPHSVLSTTLMGLAPPLLALLLFWPRVFGHEG